MFHQFLMISNLHYASLMHHDNLISMTDGTKTMSDNYNSLSSK